MHPLGVSSVILAGASLAIAAMVLASGVRRAPHRAFALLGLGTFGWSVGWLLLSAGEALPWSDPLSRLAWATLAFLPTSLAHHLRLALELAPLKGFRIAHAIAGLVAAWALSPWFPHTLRPMQAVWREDPSVLISAIGLALVVTGPATLVFLWRPALRSSSPMLRRRARVMGAAAIALTLLGLNDMRPGFEGDWRSFADGRFGPLAALAPVLYLALFVHGVASDQWIGVRISFGRWLESFLRTTFFLGICALLLLVTTVWRPDLLTLPGVAVSMGVLLVALVATGLFAPLLFAPSADRLRRRIYGGRFRYLDEVRALALLLERRTDLSAELAEICARLRETLDIGLIEIWYRDADGEPRVAPPRPGLNEVHRLARWEDVIHEAAAWKDREDLWIIPLHTVGSEPVGYMRLMARGWSLRLNELDRATLLELSAAIARRIEGEVLRVSLDLRQANEAKDRFLAGINHEVRNPLNGLTGLLHLLRREGLRGRPAYLVETINACAEQLVATMDNALDFANLSQGRAVLRESRFELGALLRGSVAHHTVTTADRVRLRPPPAEHWLVGDAGKIRQIISNYVGNALKYGQPPRAELGAAVMKTTPERLHLCIEVRSPSPPTTGEDLGEWFKPFRRGRRAVETGASGSGLGLAICQRLAQSMSGEVGVSRDGDSLVFWLSVPVTASEPPDATPAESPPPAAAPAGSRPPRVLAIEDEAYNRLVLNHHLSSWGLEVEWAESGAEAEQKVRAQAPDLVIMDWLLGDTDGAGLLPRLSAAQPGGHAAPVVVLSAYSTEEKQNQALAAGARCFLSKPLQPESLRQAIRDALPGFTVAAASASAAIGGGPLFSTDDAEAGLREEWREVLAFRESEPERAAAHVHRMRGIARLLGRFELARSLGAFERAICDGRAEDIPAALAALAEEGFPTA